VKRQRENPDRRRRRRERLREQAVLASGPVDWLPVPVRVLGHAGPFVVGVARSAPAALRAEWLEARGAR
jgi:hypothetical protein